MLLLHRNWREGRNEIGLVAREGQTIALVEVKRLARVAAGWIAAHPGEGREFRFDIVEVTIAPGRAPLVEHWPDAFRTEDS